MSVNSITKSGSRRRPHLRILLRKIDLNDETAPKVFHGRARYFSHAPAALPTMTTPPSGALGRSAPAAQDGRREQRRHGREDHAYPIAARFLSSRRTGHGSHYRSTRAAALLGSSGQRDSARRAH